MDHIVILYATLHGESEHGTRRVEISRENLGQVGLAYSQRIAHRKRQALQELLDDRRSSWGRLIGPYFSDAYAEVQLEHVNA